MEHLSDTMAAKFSDDAEMVVFRVALNGIAYVAESSAGANLLNSLVHTFLSDFAQALRDHRRLTGKEHLAGITVIPVFDDSDVDVDCITIF